MVAPGGYAWDTTRYGDTINERAVRILLECILVKRTIQTCKLLCKRPRRYYRFNKTPITERFLN